MGTRLESLQNVRDHCYIQITCLALFVSLNDSSIVSFFMKILLQEPLQKFKVRSREISHARQTFQSGMGSAVHLGVQASI